MNLREQIAQRYTKRRFSYNKENILITTGSQQVDVYFGKVL